MCIYIYKCQILQAGISRAILKLLLYSKYTFTSYFRNVQVKRIEIVVDLIWKSLFQITRPNKTGWFQQNIILIFWGFQLSSWT